MAHRVDLTGELDPAALRQAIEALAHRHVALRMRVADHDGDLVQETLAPFPVPLPVDDVADADQWCQEISATPFSLEAAAVPCPARQNRTGTLDPGSGAAPYCLRFWRAELSEVDLVPKLPCDRPRPEVLSGRGALHESALPPELVDRIRTVAGEMGGTPYAILATAFALWLARLCGQPDVVLATSSANRTRREHEDVVGMIGDAVLVRVRTNEAGFDELVRQFSAGLCAAMDHQDLPLTEVVTLVAPELRDKPFPAVLFTVVTTPPPTFPLDGMESRVRGVSVPGLARTELYVRIVADPDKVEIFWEYSTDLFTKETITGWDTDLRTLLEQLTRAHNLPDQLAA